MAAPVPNPVPETANDLSIYVHIPFCEKKGRYCSFYSIPFSPKNLSAFFNAILSELDLYSINVPIRTLYIGGGSPSVLPNELFIPFIRRLLERTGPVAECTIEINPAQADKQTLIQLKTAGINRLSIGAQSFQQTDLDFLGRLHTVEDIRRAIEDGRAAGFDNTGVDLIYAIPGSSLPQWKQTLQTAIDLDVQHISAYRLCGIERIWS